MILMVVLLGLWGLVGGSGVEATPAEPMEVMEGDSVTLHTDLKEIRDDDLILWTFGPKDSYVAKIGQAHRETFPDSVDGRFRGRLRLDPQTGSLTITNTSTEHSGSYTRETVNGNKVSIKTFSVTVYASLSIPVISSYSASDPSRSGGSSGSRCVLLCSVRKVAQVTLSWYRGSGLLSSISLSELNTTVSLHLELEHQDNHTYSCVVHNPLSERSKLLHPSDLCGPQRSACVDYGHGFAEAVIRLVVSALVGVATVAVVIYDTCSRRV